MLIKFESVKVTWYMCKRGFWSLLGCLNEFNLNQIHVLIFHKSLLEENRFRIIEIPCKILIIIAQRLLFKQNLFLNCLI